MAERESHMEMFSEKQLETVDKIFDTYHADYFYVMGYEIGIVDGDLAQALRELSDRQLQIVLMYYFIGWTDRIDLSETKLGLVGNGSVLLLLL